jgi:transcriptional regulator with XRE-family HTH domain
MGIVGDRLKQLRTDKGLYPSEVAKFLGITRPAYLKYENGQTEHPRKLDELAAFFGVSTDYLLGRTDIPTTPITKLLGEVGGPSALEQAAAKAQVIEETPKHRVLVDASQGLSDEEMDVLIDMANILRAKHNID